MSSYPRSQDGYIQTGDQGQYRVRGQRGNWWVEGTDNNGVWVDSEPGDRYRTKAEAKAAADNLHAIRTERTASR